MNIDHSFASKNVEFLKTTPKKGGDPAAGSPTATLLRLHPNHRPNLGRLPPCGWHSDFW